MVKFPVSSDQVKLGAKCKNNAFLRFSNKKEKSLAYLSMANNTPPI